MECVATRIIVLEFSEQNRNNDVRENQVVESKKVQQGKIHSDWVSSVHLQKPLAANVVLKSTQSTN